MLGKTLAGLPKCSCALPAEPDCAVRRRLPLLLAFVVMSTLSRVSSIVEAASVRASTVPTTRSRPACSYVAPIDKRQRTLSFDLLSLSISLCAQLDAQRCGCGVPQSQPCRSVESVDRSKFQTRCCVVVAAVTTRNASAVRAPTVPPIRIWPASRRPTPPAPSRQASTFCRSRCWSSDFCAVLVRAARGLRVGRLQQALQDRSLSLVRPSFGVTKPT